jgi:PPM family protein phosphatase
VSAYKLSAFTAQHIGDRHEQQDRMCLLKHPRLKGVSMAVLADGMGGRTGGGIAAEQVINTCEQLFNSSQELESIPEMLASAVLEAHAVIKLLSLSEEKEPHSTMVALVMTPTHFHWVHVGDSRLYMFRDNAMHEVTCDHSFVIDAILAGKLTPEQAAVHPNRNMLTSALGMATEPRYTLGELHQPQVGDTFLIASDGVWGHFKTQELTHILSAMPAKTASKLLIELSRERAQGRGDNASLIIINVKPDDTVDTVFG